MLVPIQEVKKENFVDENEENRRAWNDILRNANTSMMSWAEKNFRLKTIDILYHMRYYRSNQTIYLTLPSKGKE